MASSTPLTVLLVEDDLVFQDVFRRVFTEMPGNWQIQAVGDGAAALQALAQSKQGFALALVDIGLPDMLGTQVIAAIRHRFAQLPILVTTTFQSERTFLEAVRAGAQGYLLKNETTISLRAAIEHVLQGQYPVSPALARHLFHLAGAAPHAGSPQKVLAPSALSDAVKLSARELELLNHLANGHSYAECAQLMRVSLSTVQSHIRNTYRKLQVKNHRQALNKIQSMGSETP